MAMIVRLNGSNYLSEKTRGAFENALQEGPTVKSQAAALPVAAAPAVLSAEASRAEPETAPAVSGAVVDYSQAWETLERGLAQSFDHQQMTLKVHEQYLGNQADYARLFSELLQQQGAIFAGISASPQQTAAAAPVLESLSHSMARFHDLQAETLEVHKQFLFQQADYSRAYVELLQEQHAALIQAPVSGNGRHKSNGNGNGNGHGNRGNGKEHPSGNGRNHGNGHHPVAIPGAVPVVTAPAPVLTAPRSAAPVAAAVVTAPAPVAVAAATALDLATVTQSLLAVVSEKTGYPVEMLDLGMDMEADLGIDSIKRVEILGALLDRHPELPQVGSEVLSELRTLGQIVDSMGAQAGGTAKAVESVAPVAVVAPEAPAAGVDFATVTTSLLAVVSEKTGYPAEMLDLGMDMEADLGIDSIKRVEILGALLDRHPELPKVGSEVLSELRTLGQIVEFMGTQAGGDVKKNS